MRWQKNFISYKYSESQAVRDGVLDVLGENATYYQGETADSPDLTDTSTANIKKTLTNMMHDTSVTVIVVSPSFVLSKWVNWEIEYSLKEITRRDRTSRTNGVVGVIREVNGGCDWLVTIGNKDDGCTVRSYDIPNSTGSSENHYNRKKGPACRHCKTQSHLDGSYISLVEESAFLSNPDKYIDNAFDKSEHVDAFHLRK